MKTKSILCGAASAVVIAALSMSPSVAAQSFGAADEEVTRDEITVTARKREETVQEAPLSVDVVGQETIERYNINEVEDISSRIPSLNIQTGDSGGGSQIYLRGIGSSNISAAFDSAVALNFDGVVVSTSRIVQAAFVDTAQIDILKGPQSLYFGKSASAGVISIRSADPTDEWEFGGRGSYEFEEQGYLFGGYLSGPLTDSLGVRVALQYNDIDRYIELQPDTPAQNLERGLENLNVRSTLQWDPTDRFRANLKFAYSRNENDGAIQHTDVFCGANGVADPLVSPVGGLIPGGNNCNIDDKFYFLPDAAPPIAQQAPIELRGAEQYNSNPGVPFGETDIFFSRLRMDFDITENLTLTSVSGYVDMQADDIDNYSYGGVGPATDVPPGSAFEAANGPGVPFGLGTGFTNHDLEQFSQEVRLVSEFDGWFNFMLGGFYETRDYRFATAQQAVNISLIAADPVTGNTFDWLKDQLTTGDALSFFGSVTLDITDQIELSGGVRWVDENRESVISVPYLHTFLQGPGFVAPGFISDPIEFSDSNVSPEVTLSYKATNNINLYAAYKTGFKSGGVDNSALPSASLLGIGDTTVDPNDPDGRTFDEIAIEGIVFDSETAEGGELGAKTQFFDRALTVNTALFYYVFEDLQVQNFDGTTVQFFTSNAGEVTTRGVDVTFNWQTPEPGLVFSGSLLYNDAEFTDTFIGLGEDLDGRDVARAPECSGNFAFDYFAPVSSQLELGLSGNVAFSGSYFTADARNDDFVQDSYARFDASLSLGSADRGWKLALIGTNLSDERFVSFSVDRPFRSPPNDDVYISQNRGRQLFLEASFNF